MSIFNKPERTDTYIKLDTILIPVAFLLFSTGILYPCVLTNPPKETELLKGDHLYYFSSSGGEDGVTGSGLDSGEGGKKSGRQKSFHKHGSGKSSGGSGGGSAFTPSMRHMVQKIARARESARKFNRKRTKVL
jgi:hypothetical protein